MDFGEDPIEKLKQWKQRKGLVEKKVKDNSPKSPTQAFCAWTEDFEAPKLKGNVD
jgi:hypothetical protein